MAHAPTLAEQEELTESRRARSGGVSTRERIAGAALSLGFLAATAGLWVADPPHAVDLGAVSWTLVVMVFAHRVRFETPFGSAAATQLAFVPLVLGLPPACVPVAACVALVLSALPDILLRGMPPARLLSVFRNCACALGPAWVLALAGPARAADAAILLAALAAQFLVDFGVSSGMTFLTRGTGLRAQLGLSWVYVVDGALSGIGYMVALETMRSAYAVLVVLPLLGVLAMFGHERSGRGTSVLELGETYRGTALLLGEVVAADDGYTARHSRGVVVLALAVGEVLGLEPHQRRNLEFAALLHDVGKITIPKEIIRKPGKLDPDEWQIIRTHSVTGQQMLARAGGFMTEIGGIVRSHHERWDGGGYPDGLHGEAAPLEARIITACDSWSAMRTDRPYRGALSREAAIDEVERNVGTQFDPTVADALLAVVGAEDEEPATEVVAAGLGALLRA